MLLLIRAASTGLLVFTLFLFPLLTHAVCKHPVGIFDRSNRLRQGAKMCCYINQVCYIGAKCYNMEPRCKVKGWTPTLRPCRNKRRNLEMTCGARKQTLQLAIMCKKHIKEFIVECDKELLDAVSRPPIHWERINKGMPLPDNFRDFAFGEDKQLYNLTDEDIRFATTLPLRGVQEFDIDDIDDDDDDDDAASPSTITHRPSKAVDWEREAREKARKYILNKKVIKGLCSRREDLEAQVEQKRQAILEWFERGEPDSFPL
jgi:hypothetical protein